MKTGEPEVNPLCRNLRIIIPSKHLSAACYTPGSEHDFVCLFETKISLKIRVLPYVLYINQVRYIIQRDKLEHSQYTLPATNMNFFLFQRFFAFLWSVQGVSVLEIHSYE